MPAADTEFSVLLWTLGVFVAALAIHLGQDWVRMAQRHQALQREWPALLLASTSLGIGITSALEVGMQAHALPFAMGYRWQAVAVLVPLSVLVCAPAVVIAAWRTRPLALAFSGAWLGAAALGLDAGWIWATGFRPGVVWRPDLLAAAALLVVTGLALAQWVAFSPVFQDSERRTLWRMAAALLAALTLMAGQQVMSWAAGLETQVQSIHKDEVPGWVLSLVCGVVVPLVLVAMQLDLWLRRQQMRERRARRDGDLKLHKRRKRRHKQTPLL